MNPTRTVSLMEDHDGALRTWQAAGIKNRILLHFDAHLDFAPILPSARALLEEPTLEAAVRRAGESPLWDRTGKTSGERAHLGNYIHEAIRAGVVREFVWVYPDGTEPRRQEAAAARLLAGLNFGVPFRAIPLSRLSEIAPREPVLLDVDADFFAIRDLDSEHYPLHDPGVSGCWVSPQELVDRLRAAGIAFDLATISYSVEEGYTPLTLKFLGDELAARLAGALAAERERLYELLRAAPALDALEDALTRWRAPALLFSAALHLAKAGLFDRAKALYEEAVARDPSYRTRYNHPGQALRERGRFAEAEPHFALMRRLDPEHPHYRLAELEDLLRAGEPARALALGTAIFAGGAREPELLLALAECRLELREPDAARTWLAFCRPEALPPHLLARYWALKAKTADSPDEALEAYHHVLRLSVRAPRAHLALARIYLRKRNFFKARRHAWKALKFWGAR